MQPFRNSGSTVTIAAAALAVTLLLVYLKGLSGPFIFDDFANLADNPRLVPAENTPLDWRSSALSSESGPLRRALPMLSFALQAALEGELTAPVSKVINLIVHALCTLLVGLLAAQLARAPLARLNERQQLWIPLLAAAVWGLNPLHVSTVLYAVQRMAQFSTLFVLLGLVVFLHYRNIWARERPSSAQIFAFLSWLFSVACIPRKTLCSCRGWRPW